MNDTEGDRASLATVLCRAGEVFQTAVSPAMAQEYFKALSAYPTRQVVWAVEECIKDCLFFPKPAEIIKAMFAVEGDQAPEVFQQVLDQRKALEGTRIYEIPEDVKRHIDELLAQCARPLPTSRVVRDTDGNLTAESETIRAEESSRMTDTNWRARWDLGKYHTDLLYLREAIPMRLRLQFASEDSREGNT